MGGVLVEVAGGLVEQHQCRPVDQGTGDGHTLALAAGQFGRLVRQAMAQAHAFQQRRGPLARFADGGAADQQRHADVLQGGELRQQVVELVDETQGAVAQQAAGGFAEGGQLLAGQPDAALARGIQATQHVQQGALAGAGTADDGHPLARMQFQLDAGQDLHGLRAFVVALAQVAATQDCLVTHSAKPLLAGCARHARRGKGWRRSSGPARPNRPAPRPRPSAGMAGNR
ncbi:hypothetical protein D3C80_624640 [compost metagenome]